VIEIRSISAEQTWPLRSRVLKPFLKPHECANPGDEEPTTLHLGAFRGNAIVGIATFLAEKHPFFPHAERPYRLRGMATDPDHHRQGVGRALVEAGEAELTRRGCDLLWFNARERAFPFYRALGFDFLGEMFEIPLIGPHKVMYKAYGRR
jgi:hypothetical protein